ncbi:MAG: gliding motility-associated C-terminal domain-containing protein [Flavobacteriales bacterium]
MKKLLIHLLPIALVVINSARALGQECGDALANNLCGGQPQQVNDLVAAPYSNQCIFTNPALSADSLYNTVWYSFHTGTDPTRTSVTVSIDFVDCDSDAGNDYICASYFPVAEGADPCGLTLTGPSLTAPCTGGNDSFEWNLPEIQPNTTYVLIVGSNHQPQGGGAADPCAFNVTLSGSALSIEATVEPLSVSLGESAGLIVEGADPDSDIQWTPGEYLSNDNVINPQVVAEETTAFQVTANIGDCELTDVVSITVGSPVEIYTAISPNGDNINDVWNIKDIERFPTCQVEVFDRWGQSLFKSVGYQQPWDGTYKGKYLPTGPYYYVIELNSLEVTIPPLLGVVSIVH